MNALIRTALLALAVPLVTIALPVAAQNQAPIHVEADRLDLDQRAGTAVYTGNVDIRQGNMQLRGERVTMLASCLAPSLRASVLTCVTKLKTKKPL